LCATKASKNHDANTNPHSTAKIHAQWTKLKLHMTIPGLLIINPYLLRFSIMSRKLVIKIIKPARLRSPRLLSRFDSVDKSDT